MKNRLFAGIGVIVLCGAFLVSNRSAQAIAAGNPMPPCPPQGCTIPPAR